MSIASENLTGVLLSASFNCRGRMEQSTELDLMERDNS